MVEDGIRNIRVVGAVGIHAIGGQGLNGHCVPPAIAVETGLLVVAAALAPLVGGPHAANLPASEEEADVLGHWVMVPVVVHEAT